MININQLHTELKKKGKSFTYVKVKNAVDGVPGTTSKDEKREILSVIDEQIRIAKTNILKS